MPQSWIFWFASNVLQIVDGKMPYPKLWRAPWELPVSSQRASRELSVHEQTIPVWNYLSKHLFVIFFFIFTTFIGRFLCLTHSLFCHVFLHFCKCWKVFSHSVLTSSTKHAATSFALLSNLMSFWFAFFIWAVSVIVSILPIMKLLTCKNNSFSWVDLQWKVHHGW